MFSESFSQLFKKEKIPCKLFFCTSNINKRLILLVFIFIMVLAFISFYNPSFYSKLSLQEVSKKLKDLRQTDAFGKHPKVHGTQRRLPQCIIIGARKCGTRALLEMASLHPYIMKKGNEMHFFDSTKIFANGLEWYRKKMPYSYENQVTIEKTPSYFVSPDAPYRIRAMNASIRLILIVREPVYRVVSDYTQVMESRKMKGKDVIPFEQLVLTEDGDVNTSYSAIKISEYFVHMINWLRVFPRKQFLILDGEQLIRDPYSVLIEVEKFLDLPPRLKSWNFYFNETKGFFCMRNETRQKCLLPSKGRPHLPVDPVIVRKLRQYFSPFNDHFYDLVGLNFSWVVN